MARVLLGNVRPDIEYLETLFAPAGYGLGKHASIISDLDGMKVCGWFDFGEGANGSPFPYGGALLVLSKGTSFIQLAFNSASADWGGAGGIARRIGSETTWHEWEYINPPMALGVEYRTTERWNGKPVYAMLYDMGQLANNGETISYYHVNSITEAKHLVESRVIISDSYGNEEEAHDFKVLVLPNSTVQYGYKGDKSGYTGKLFIKYTYE